MINKREILVKLCIGKIREAEGYRNTFLQISSQCNKLALTCASFVLDTLQVIQGVSMSTQSHFRGVFYAHSKQKPSIQTRIVGCFAPRFTANCIYDGNDKICKVRQHFQNQHTLYPAPNRTCNLVVHTAVVLQTLPCFTFTVNLCRGTYLNDKMTHRNCNVWKLCKLRSIICKWQQFEYLLLTTLFALA
jgi:hypothetical protein